MNIKKNLELKSRRDFFFNTDPLMISEDIIDGDFDTKLKNLGKTLLDRTEVYISDLRKFTKYYPYVEDSINLLESIIERNIATCIRMEYHITLYESGALYTPELENYIPGERRVFKSKALFDTLGQHYIDFNQVLHCLIEEVKILLESPTVSESEQSKLKHTSHIIVPAKEKPQFRMSEKKGAKIDLIRILNSLYELRLVDKTDGQTPTKQEFMEAFGNLLGISLSKYHSNLSQSLKEQPLEVNLKVFEEMKLIIQNSHYLHKKEKK